MKTLTQFEWLESEFIHIPHEYVLQAENPALLFYAIDAGESLEDIQGATAHASERAAKFYASRIAQNVERLQKLRGIVD